MAHARHVHKNTSLRLSSITPGHARRVHSPGNSRQLPHKRGTSKHRFIKKKKKRMRSMRRRSRRIEGVFAEFRISLKCLAESVTPMGILFINSGG